MRKQTAMKKCKIKTGDRVIAIAGSNKGAQGKVIRVSRAENRVWVAGVNIMKKHAKPSAENPQGGVVQVEAPIHISNVALVDPKGGATRVGYKWDQSGNKRRYAKKSGALI